jgi:hypothetical protein
LVKVVWVLLDLEYRHVQLIKLRMLVNKPSSDQFHSMAVGLESMAAMEPKLKTEVLAEDHHMAVPLRD